jgi:hypothetical protein
VTKLWNALVQQRERLCALVRIYTHALLRELAIHALLQAKATRLELRERLLLLLLLLLLLWNQARRKMGTMARADVGTTVIKSKLSELHDGIVEELRISLCVEKR